MIENLWSKSAQRLGEWPLALVSRLIVDHVEASEHALSNAEPRQWGNPTANEWLAGAELPCVFEEHFHRKPGGSRNKTYKKGGGPCVRFIEATMHELGVRYSPASILRTMTHSAIYDPRRRPGPRSAARSRRRRRRRARTGDRCTASPDGNHLGFVFVAAAPPEMRIVEVGIVVVCIWRADRATASQAMASSH